MLPRARHGTFVVLAPAATLLSALSPSLASDRRLPLIPPRPPPMWIAGRVPVPN
jgi:hypothetical protein